MIDDLEVAAAKEKPGRISRLAPAIYGKDSGGTTAYLLIAPTLAWPSIAEPGLLDGRTPGTLQLHPSLPSSLLFVVDPVPAPHEKVGCLGWQQPGGQEQLTTQIGSPICIRSVAARARQDT